jgi:hypothetical protein
MLSFSDHLCFEDSGPDFSYSDSYDPFLFSMDSKHLLFTNYSLVSAEDLDSVTFALPTR